MAFRTELWTDGACSGNPGPGGWAYVLVAYGANGDVVKMLEGHGGERETTNNRMEIAAAIKGLGALRRATDLRIVSDSAYLTNAFRSGWIEKWQRNGWRSGRDPVKNQDLWRALLAVAAPHNCEWMRVKGHAGNALNNRCDQLAVHQRDIHAGRIAAGALPPPPDTRARAAARRSGTDSLRSSARA